jgi:LmbE family N-acetylglucosaminyl deacetylase
MKESLRLLLARAVRQLLRANSSPLPLGTGPVLIVAPHADDETLGCGGLLAALGSRAHVVFVADSANAEWSRAATRAERAAARRAEALAALGQLGLEARQATFLDAPDGALDRLGIAEHERVLALFAETLRTVRPQRIFLPLLGEGSTEHDAAVWLAREALQVAGLAPELWEYPVWAWWNALRLRGQFLRSDENFFHDATPWLSAKHRALACHGSQLAPSASGNARVPVVIADAAAEPTEFYFRRRTFFP